MAARRTVALLAKHTTGIVGLDVVPNARAVLVRLYAKTLSDVQIMPAHVPYRQVVESFTKHRMYTILDSDDDVSAERAIGHGQLEELIEQAQSELQLIPLYASWKIWELSPPTPQEDGKEHSIFADMSQAEIEHHRASLLLEARKKGAAL